MPIGLWWWIEPLFETGIVTLILFTPFAVLFEKTGRPSLATFVAFMAVAPLVFVPLNVVLWFVTNILIMIWR